MTYLTPTATSDDCYCARAIARMPTGSMLENTLGPSQYFKAGPTDNERIEPRLFWVWVLSRVRESGARVHMLSRVRGSCARGAGEESGESASHNIGYRCVCARA